MEKRRVTVMIGGQACSFVTDDSDEYISALAFRANAVMKQTAKFAGPSAYANAILSVVSLTDELMRLEKEKSPQKAEERVEARQPKKTAAKTATEDKGQVSVWDLLE